MRSGMNFGLMTDHPVTLSQTLRESLKYFLVSGMKEAEALALITSVNADILGIGDRVGRIEKNLLASMLVWDRDPLRLDALPKVVIAEGKILSHQKYTR